MMILSLFLDLLPRDVGELGRRPGRQNYYLFQPGLGLSGPVDYLPGVERSDANMTNYEGCQFDQYRIDQLIAQGGFADVYKAWDDNLKRWVAIKVLNKRLTAEELTKFFEEACIMASLRHPHIVTVFSFNNITLYDPDRDRTITIPYLVMDFAPRGSLKQRHPLGERLSLDTIMGYLEQIVDALEYIHNHNLVHLDIKPANILVGADYEILLSDFGIARFIQNAHAQKIHPMEDDWVGTAMYMAPERFRGQVSPATDQYALGIILFEWLTGESPFYGTDDLQIMWRHIDTQAPSLREICPDISVAVERVVLKALSKDPHARFKNVRELFFAFDEARHISFPRLLISLIRGYH